MSVNVIDTIKPKNGGSFPVVEAADVSVGAQRLPAALEAKADASALAGKADQADVNALTSQLAGKANNSDLVDIRTSLTLKANQSSLDATNVIVASKAAQSSLDALTVIVERKADKKDYNDIYDAIDLKADKTALTAVKDELSAEDLNLQNQIDQIEISASAEAVVAPEVAAARVGADGTSYQTLKARLDAEKDGSELEIRTIREDFYSVNLFDVSTFTQDTERDASTGELIANANGYGTSALIPVDAERTVYFSYYGSALAPTFIYYFGKDGTYTSRGSGATSVEIPSTCGFISVCIPNNKANAYQIEYTEVTPYQAHGIAVNRDAIEQNAFNTELVSNKIRDNVSVNMFDVGTFTDNSERGTIGQIIANAGGYGTSDLIPVTVGKTVYFSYNGEAMAPTYLYLFTADGHYTGRETGASTKIIPEGCGFISVCIPKANKALYQIQYDAVTSYAKYGLMLDTAEISGMDEDIQDIKKIVYSPNLFNVATFTRNAERSHGEIVPNVNGYGVSDLISVHSGETVYFSYNGEALEPTYLYTFAPDGTYIRSYTTPETFTVTDAVGYISVCIPNAKSDYYQVEYDAVSAYSSYGKTIKDKVDTIEEMIITGTTENPLEIIKETPGYLSAFHNVGCIGDSLASGLSTAKKDGNTYNLNLYDFSWGQCLARATGNTYYNWSVGGLSTRTWLASEYATECYDGQHKCSAYIIGLGQNDYNNSIPVGTIEDIKSDYTLNPDTFYGNYGKIIQRIKAMFPKTKPKIFVCTDPLQAVETAGYNTAVRAIAEYFDNVWLLDLYTYGRAEIRVNDPMATWKRDAHFNAMGYQYISWVIGSYIDWIIRKDYEHFCDVELIGTEYDYHADEDL